MSMQRVWQGLSTCTLRSDSREGPRRIGVAGVGEVGNLDFAVVVEGVMNGFVGGGAGGERIRMIWT